jgi:hypothetical protein
MTARLPAARVSFEGAARPNRTGSRLHTPLTVHLRPEPLPLLGRLELDEIGLRSQRTRCGGRSRNRVARRVKSFLAPQRLQPALLLLQKLAIADGLLLIRDPLSLGLLGRSRIDRRKRTALLQLELQPAGGGTL